ncbi:Myosin-13, partial [Hondaea fermentalgiana]
MTVETSQRNVWVLVENSYLEGRIAVDEPSEDFVDVSVETLGVTIPISRENVYETNPDVSSFYDLDDLTSLRHLHEPAILHVLEGRSYENQPYTYLSGILVSVNPLERTSEALQAGFKAAPGTYVPPHPFALAETAFQQMCFATKNQDRSCTSAQSIVIAGESGAGKTEVAKRVIQHLIKRSGASPAQISSGDGSPSLEQQLLGLNPILESFGNAATLRNHNSSRFGKFTKLHFDCDGSSESGATLAHASICSYLLERSRIAFHSPGERSFRVFYELINGADTELRDRARLGPVDQSKEGYIFNFVRDKDAAERDCAKQLERDKAAFAGLVEALRAVGLGKRLDDIFLMVACVLHLGNLEIEEEESEQGSVACIKNEQLVTEGVTSDLLGLPQGSLQRLLCERTVNLPGGESVRVRRKLLEALEARNALAKSLYSALFDWLIERINHKLAPDAMAAERFKDSYVGVLDIFGFETFARNDFEQLLINFANEALQETFREKVLVAEALLYRQEGLVLDDATSSSSAGDDIASCLALLEGTKSQPGILQKLAAESECPNPKDDRFVSTLHSSFARHPQFLAPHPKDKRTTFIVSHYASDVTYTVGKFTQKNLDRLPKDAQVVLGQSTREFVADMLAAAASSAGGSGAAASKRQQRTIATQFSKQISALVRDLNATQCSFVRCIKPNLTMRRDHSNGRWFDSSYVLDQLRCLGIAQTAKALRGGGFPTRIDYKDVMENFKEQIPKEHFEACTKLLDVGAGGCVDDTARRRRRNARFIRALFWAFDIPQDAYRCGLTKVFFKPGALQKVDAMLAASREQADANVGDDAEIAESARLARFREHCARSAWRSCCTKVIAANRFLDVLQAARKAAEARRRALERRAAVRIQATWRMALAMDNFRIIFQAVLSAQSFWRMCETRKAYLAEQQRRKEAAQALAEAEAEAAAAQAAAEAAAAKRQQEAAAAVAAAEAAEAAAKAQRQLDIRKRSNNNDEVTNDEREEDADEDEDVQDEEEDEEDEHIEEDDEDEEEADRLREQAMRCQQQMQLMMIKEAILAENERREAAADTDGSMSTIPEENEDDVSSWASRSQRSRSSSASASGDEGSHGVSNAKRGTGERTKKKDGDANAKSGSKSGTTASGRQMTGRKQRLYSRRNPSSQKRVTAEHDQKKQRTIFLRLRQEERSYVDALSIINGNYYKPVLETLIIDEPGSTKGLLRQDAESIFSNLPQLLKMHFQMLASIEEELAKQKQDPMYAMTSTFLGKLRESLPFLRTVYLVYVKQNSTSLSILSRARAEVPKFARFLRLTAENKTLPSYGTDLRDLLKIPINQMARYHEFLNMLLSCTHPDSREHKDLREVCKRIEGITRELDNERRLARLRMRAYEIANELEGVGKPAWKRKGKTQLLNNVNNPRSHHSLMDLSAAAAASLQSSHQRESFPTGSSQGQAIS